MKFDKIERDDTYGQEAQNLESKYQILNPRSVKFKPRDFRLLNLSESWCLHG